MFGHVFRHVIANVWRHVLRHVFRHVIASALRLVFGKVVDLFYEIKKASQHASAGMTKGPLTGCHCTMTQLKTRPFFQSATCVATGVATFAYTYVATLLHRP